jgi:hypothetical protein
MTRLLCALLAAQGFVLLPGAVAQTDATTPERPAGVSSAVRPEWKRGRELALKYCSSCHLAPEPDALTKSAWVHQIQPEMAKWVGLEPVDYEGMADGNILREAALYPPSPILPEEDWFALWDYYRAAAPSRLDQGPRPHPVEGLKQFKVRKVNPHTGVPMTCLVKIDPPRRRVYMADTYGGSFFVLNAAGGLVSRNRLGSPAVSVSIRDNGLTATLISRIFPSDALEGSVAFIPFGNLAASGASPPPMQVLLEGLRRPTDAVVADLNQDGREDLVVCSFGSRLGRFSWFEGRASGGYDEHVLLDRPGAIRAEVRDFDGDGRPDVLVMMAQAREGIYLFLNQGGGKFRMETVLEEPPNWGLAGLELADLNRDGHPDLVVANGDQGDLPLPLKPYHGIRVYLNDGHNHFREAFFYPMHGAYKAVARDFDGDGDLDLAAIAFYPDYAHDSPESFVYLENKGGPTLSFEAFTCPEQNAGRWLVMDAGDVDGDGDEDIILGSFVRGPTTAAVPGRLRDAWRNQGAVLLWLENLRVNR